MKNFFIFPEISNILIKPLMVFLLFIFTCRLLWKKMHSIRRNLGHKIPQFVQFISILSKEVKKPFFLLVAILFFYVTANFIFNAYPLLVGKQAINKLVFNFLEKLIFPLSIFWLIWRSLSALELFVYSASKINKYFLFTTIFPFISDGIKAAIILLIANTIIPWLGITGFLEIALEKISRILFISVVGWILLQIINRFEKIILDKYGQDNNDYPTSRQIKTQVLILKRVIISILFIIVFAAILMVFDNVKNFGAGILTTAGILSAVGAFASQQSLSKLITGLQMAFMQPIRINDWVIIDGQTGTVEEMSISYVVIKLWDLRRLVVPVDHLITKGFYNLSRTSTQLLDTVFLYVDFHFPIDIIREKFFELIEQSKFWDHKIKAFHVTAVTESNMELRALMSAADNGNLWELRCEIREKLMNFIVENYPSYLPKTRIVVEEN